MIKKILSLLSIILPVPALAVEAVCTVNGRIVKCPAFIEAIGPFFAFIIFGVMVLVIVSQWKVFKKAGKPGWAVIVPIYNLVVMLEIANRPLWWILLMLIPFVNIIVGIIVLNDMAKSFGKGTGFTLGLMFLPFIFFPILAFGPAEYLKPVRI